MRPLRCGLSQMLNDALSSRKRRGAGLSRAGIAAAPSDARPVPPGIAGAIHVFTGAQAAKGAQRLRFSGATPA